MRPHSTTHPQVRRSLETTGRRGPDDATHAKAGAKNARGALTRGRGLPQVRRGLEKMGRRGPDPATYARKEAKYARGVLSRGPRTPPLLERPGGRRGLWMRGPSRRRGDGVPAASISLRMLTQEPRGLKCWNSLVGPTPGRRGWDRRPLANPRPPTPSRAPQPSPLLPRSPNRALSCLLSLHATPRPLPTPPRPFCDHSAAPLRPLRAAPP